jgi:hypothetical protein
MSRRLLAAQNRLEADVPSGSVARVSGTANTSDRSSTEWFDDESFGIDEYPVMFSDQRGRSAG